MIVINKSINIVENVSLGDKIVFAASKMLLTGYVLDFDIVEDKTLIFVITDAIHYGKKNPNVNELKNKYKEKLFKFNIPFDYNYFMWFIPDQDEFLGVSNKFIEQKSTCKFCNGITIIDSNNPMLLLPAEKNKNQNEAMYQARKIICSSYKSWPTCENDMNKVAELKVYNEHGMIKAILKCS